MKIIRRLFSAAATGVLLAACADSYDARVAALTRLYVEGRISARRYHESCHVINAERERSSSGVTHETSESSTASDTSTTNDHDDDKKKCGDKNKDGHHPPPGTVAHCPPPPPR